MRIRTNVTLASQVLGIDQRRLEFNQRERSTILAAVRILDQARETIRADMGEEEFADSPWYVLRLEDMADPIEWEMIR